MKLILALLAASTLGGSLPFKSPGLDYPTARVTVIYGDAKDVSGPENATYYTTPDGEYLGYEVPFKNTSIDWKCYSVPGDGDAYEFHYVKDGTGRDIAVTFKGRHIEVVDTSAQVVKGETALKITMD